MRNIADQRCYNHASREAVARCPECNRFFCRECVSEHAGRVLCSRCLAEFAKPRLIKKLHLSGIMTVIQILAGIAMAWLAFYLFGRILLTIPGVFHEGTLW